jgi:hypothetical protein
MTKKLLFVSTLAIAFALTAFAADVTGKWVFEQAGRQGGNPVKVTLNLKADGNKLTGTISRPGRDGNAMESEITEGKIDGNNVSFKAAAGGRGGQAPPAEYTGTLSGDELKLKINRQTQNGPQTTEVTAKKATT